MNKIREREKLLKAFKETGDQDYLRAAECLQIPLMDFLEQQRKYPGRRRLGAAGKAARPRLYRMARSVAAGTTVYAAACQEVAEHGQGSHASKESAIDYLRSQYAVERTSIEDDLAALNAVQKRWQALAWGHSLALELYRSANLSLPSMRPAAWVQIAQSFLHSLTSWRNTQPKIAENKSNDVTDNT